MQLQYIVIRENQLHLMSEFSLIKIFINIQFRTRTHFYVILLLRIYFLIYFKIFHNFKCIYFNISCFKMVILLTTSNTINTKKIIIIIYIWIAIGILLHTWPTEIWMHVCTILELSIIVNLHFWESNKNIFIKIDTT